MTSRWCWRRKLLIWLKCHDERKSQEDINKYGFNQFSPLFFYHTHITDRVNVPRNRRDKTIELGRRENIETGIILCSPDSLENRMLVAVWGRDDFVREEHVPLYRVHQSPSMMEVRDWWRTDLERIWFVSYWSAEMSFWPSMIVVWPGERQWRTTTTKSEDDDWSSNDGRDWIMLMMTSMEQVSMSLQEQRVVDETSFEWVAEERNNPCRYWSARWAICSNSLHWDFGQALNNDEIHLRRSRNRCTCRSSWVSSEIWERTRKADEKAP